jgi:rare lipoprotein A
MANITDGVASYYGDRFHGRTTASGARFDKNALTAAHKTLDFGTRVTVTNKVNGRSVDVVITDRGPYTRGRTIDLSKAAAREIGMLGAGVARVRMEISESSSISTSRAASISVADAQRVMLDLF